MVIAQNKTIEDIAAAIKEKANIKEPILGSEFAEKIRSITGGGNFDIRIHRNESGQWVRPAAYPNIDLLLENDSAEEVLYLTYDNTDENFRYIGLTSDTTTGAFVIQQGYEENGSFVEINRWEAADNSYFEAAFADDTHNYIVFRVSPKVGHFNTIKFSRITAALTGRAINTPYYYNMCVERVGRLPYIINFTVSSSNYGWGTYYLEREAIQNVATKSTLTRMDYIYSNCFYLQDIDFSGWHNANMKLTTTAIQSMFQNCYFLDEIDLSWLPNTQNWTITNISNMFSNCYNLKKVNVDWDTSNWNITTISSMFQYCYSLKEIVGLENWDTSNWALTNFGYMFNYCYNLQELDLSNWNTTKWALTTMINAFNWCVHLKKLNIEGWDTSNWALTNISGCWNSCFNLLELDIGNWNTSKWALTTIGSAWAFCVSLKHLPIENWDTSNWALTTMSGCFNTMLSLEELDLSKWDTHNWKITGSQSSVFSPLYNLKTLKIPTISGWSVYPATSISNVMPYMNYIDYPPISASLNITYWRSMPREQILKIINALAPVSVKTTLTIGELRYRLTADDLAIATNKGWTIA